MNKNNYQNKWDVDLVVCIGTDIPPLSTVEFMVYGRIIELIDQKQTNILTIDEVFEGFTHTKRGRFAIISRLIKKKLIKRTKLGINSHIYEIIPKISFRKSKGMRVYKPITRRESIRIQREFTMD